MPSPNSFFAPWFKSSWRLPFNLLMFNISVLHHGFFLETCLSGVINTTHILNLVQRVFGSKEKNKALAVNLRSNNRPVGETYLLLQIKPVFIIMEGSCKRGEYSIKGY